MDTWEFDVFVSHNRVQTPWVRQFVRELRASGLSVFFDEDSIMPGADIVSAIEIGLQGSRRVIVILSPTAVESRWVALETAMTICEDPNAEQNRLIPVLIEPVELAALRPSLRRLNIVDLAQPDVREERYRSLLKHLGVSEPRSLLLTSRQGGAFGPKRCLGPRIVHTLPPAPRFVGRSPELTSLRAFWNASESGVLSLVGIGGAGKTATVARFLSDLLPPNENAPDGLFVWSFYEEPDPEIFLDQCFEYFSGERRFDVKGAGWFHLLKDTLAGGQRFLVILDGLERIQWEDTGERHSFGQLTDRLLRGFLERIASGAGNTKAIITSRFPIVDLDPWKTKGYWALNVDQLDHLSAISLLRAHGVKGSGAALERLIDLYGGHAITLDHLGSLLNRFFDGNPESAPTISQLPLRGHDVQARRLGAIFKAYERLMSPEELGVLSRLCVFRFGIAADLLVSVFSGKSKHVSGPLASMSDVDIRECLDSLVSYLLRAC